MKRKLIVLISFLFIYFTNVLAADFPRSRPNTNGEPTKVLVSFYIQDIEGIDSKGQDFTIDFVIRLKWNDPRISVEGGLIPLSQIWHPNVQINNLRDSKTRYPEAVTILDGGTVQYTQRYYAKLSSPLDLREFPFDVQTLPISLFPAGYTPDEVELVSEVAGSAEKFSISDWDIEPIGFYESVIKINSFDVASEEIVRSKIDYEFLATRYINFYWWKVLAPLLVILFLAWAVFWIEPSQVGAQIGVSGTSILTLIAFLYKLDNILPPVSYLTHLDHFIFASLVLVFIAYLEALISTTYALNGKKQLAQKLDFIFRIGYPAILFIIVLIFWIR